MAIVALASACQITVIEEGPRPPPRAPVRVAGTPERGPSRPPPRPGTTSSAARERPSLPARSDGEANAALTSAIQRRPIALGVERPSLTLRALDTTARFEAKDQAPLWEPRGATLATGERAEIELEPGCYTVIAHGGLGVLETDAFLVNGPQDQPVVLGGDNKSGPVSVVGGEGGCVQVGGPAPRAEVLVRKGAGRVVVRIFQKPRA